ncbi:hypothetical protein ACIF83_10370 [Streptomyces sp. NPDC085866]|uniref:hypothetical protein n=1 Tax=Streptomyces sp. NPDC085866 TaxID=3365736 RepID=UPI0037D0D390
MAYVPAKADARRVVLVGESAARGFLLDPGLTPADVLQGELADGAEPVQCVDLARTGAGIADLAGLVESLPHLDADAVVLFAGNNWSLQNLTVADHDRLSEGLRTRGLTGLRDVFTRQIVLPRVRALLRRLEKATAEGTGLDLVVVVPEFNLSEWRPDASWDTTLMAPDEVAAWAELHAEIEESEGLGRWSEVVGAFERMARSDGGTSPLAAWARARAHHELGDHGSARTAWEEARDAVCGLLIAHTPRATALVQAELCAFAQRGGHALVDLREELADPSTGLPDPGYFLDYCHLSPSGMVKAMRAVARCLRPATESDTRPVGPDRPGDRRIRAVGHLLSACHSAWLSQPPDVLRRQLAVAVAEAPSVSADMSDLLALLTNGVPAWLTPEYDRLCRWPNAERYLNPTALSDFGSLARTPLTELLAQALGRPVPPRIDSADLLAGRGDSAPRIVNGPTPAYFRSAAPVFRAALDPSRSSQARLRLMYRTPQAASDAESGTLEFGGRVLGRIAPSPHEWSLLEVNLPAATGASSSNELVLHWPAVQHDETHWRQQASGMLATGRIPLPVPVFGEIFEARVLV